MIKDQVRRSKKTPTKPRRSSARAPSRVAPVKRSRSVERAPKLGFAILIGILCIIGVALWYSTTQIISFLTTSSVARFTLVVSPTKLWLLAQGSETTARHYALAVESELASGLSAGVSVHELAARLSTTQTPEIDRTAASQTLGIPIDQVILVSSRADTWSDILGELRSQAIDHVQNGEWSDGLLSTWLVARMSEGVVEPQEVADVIATLERQNAAAVSSREQCPVAVLNNAGKPGFASLVSTLIEHNGGTVLRVANALTDSESDVFEKGTTIFIQPAAAAECEGTLSMLRTFFPMAIEHEDSALVGQYRATLVLLLDEEAQVATTAGALDPRQ